MGLLVNVEDGNWQKVRRNFARLGGPLLGPDAEPTFANVTITDLTASEFVMTDASKGLVSLAVPILANKGGTGLTTITNHGLMLGSGTDAVTVLAEASDGQLPIGSTGNDPVLGTLTGTANQVNVTNAAGLITLSTSQDIATTSDVEFQSLLIDQNTDAIGLTIDSAATTDTNYGLSVTTTAGAMVAEFLNGDGNAGMCYLGLLSNNAFSGTYFFGRNLTAAATDCPVVYMVQDHADDDQPVLELVQDGSGAALLVTSGSISVAEGVTISSGITVPDGGYIGSVSEPQAMQIEADGDIVFHQAIDVPSDITCGGHLMFDVDNGSVGYIDSTPRLTFNSADNQVENNANCTIAGHLAVGGASINADLGILYAELLTDTDNSVKQGISSVLQTTKTTAAMTSRASGIYSSVALDSTNTQDWSNALAGLVGIESHISTEGSSAGTVTGAINLLITSDFADAADVVSYAGIYVETPTVANDKVTTAYGLYIDNINTAGTNNYSIYTTAGDVHLGGNVECTGTIETIGLTVTNCTVLGSDSAVFQPNADSTTFFQVKDKDGNVFLTGDSTNNKTISDIFDATDEDNVLQVDGTTIFRTGASANRNMFFGEGVFNNDAGIKNIGIGYQAGYNNDTTGASSEGDQNIYIGTYSGKGGTVGFNNTGYNNVGIGYKALYYNKSGYDNMAIGGYALTNNTTGINNTGMGNFALRDNTYGADNMALGAFALVLNIGGTFNVAIGSWALRHNTYGIGNVSIGNNSSKYKATGNYNTVIGHYAGGYGGDGTRSWSNTVCIGGYSGYNNIGNSDCVFIGYKSGYNQTTLDDLLIIDNQDRTNVTNELNQAIIYGVMAATPEAQILHLNAATTIGNFEDGNYTQIEADGTIEFNGDATVWDDYVTPLGPNNWNGAANNPTLTKLGDDGAGSTGVYGYVWADGDEALVVIQMPHRWKEGTTIQPHIHFKCTTDVDPADNFGIEFEWWWADIDEDFPANTTLQTNDISTLVNSDKKHQLANVTSAGIDGSGHTISSVLECRIKRVAATGDNYAGGIVISDFDVHYEIDTVGSRTIAAK